MNSDVRQIATKVFVYTINKLWLLLATSIILLAVILTFLKNFLPHINDYRVDIEEWIEETYNFDVSTSEITAQWLEQGPIFYIKDVVIKIEGDKDDFIAMDSFTLHINIYKSVLLGRVVTEEIYLKGSKINLLIDRNLGLKLNLPLQESENVDIENSQNDVANVSRKILSFLFDQKALSVQQSTIHLQALDGRQFNYAIDTLSIDNYDQSHQLVGQLSDEQNGDLTLIAEIHGDPTDEESTTNLYLLAQNFDLSAQPVFTQNFMPQSGIVDWQLWAEWKNNHWDRALGNFVLRDYSQKTGDSRGNIRTLGLEKLSAQFNWQFINEQNGQFSLRNLEALSSEQSITRFPEIMLLFKQDSNFDIKWDLAIHDIDIQSISRLLDNEGFVDPRQMKVFRQTDLSVDVESFGIRFARLKEVWQKPKLSIEFSNLGYRSSKKIPGVKNLSGFMGLTQSFGIASLNGTNAELDFNQLFRNTIKANELSVELEWSFDENDQIQLQVDKVQLSNDDLGFQARGKFYFIDEVPALSLYSEISNIDASKKSLYLPTGLMTENLTQYLDEGVISGRLPLVKSVVHGPLKYFPFHNEEGLFSILGILEDANYRYLPGWPAAEDLKVKLLFEGNGMDLVSHYGFSNGNRVNYARAVIRDFSAPTIPFELYLDVNSTNNSGINFLSQSPLTGLAKNLSIIDLEGTARTKVELVLGLNSPDSFKLKGEVIPNTSNGYVNVLGMQYNKVKGKVGFNQNGIVPSKISATYHGEPFNVEMKTIETDDNAFLLNGSGIFPSEALGDFIGKEWNKYASGKTQVEVAVVSKSDGTTIDITSDLAGFSVDLIDDIVKKKDEKTPFKLNFEIKDNTLASIHWQDFDGIWLMEEDNDAAGFSGHFIYSKKDKSTDLKSDQLTLDFDFEQAPLDKIEDIAHTLFTRLSKNKSLSARDNSSDWAEPVESNFQINLSADSLLNSKIDINQIQLSIVGERNKPLVVKFNSDAAKGMLTHSFDEQLDLSLDFMKLKFKSEEYSADKVDIKEKESTAIWDDPTSWPSINLSCENCQINDYVLGKIKAGIHRQMNGVKVTGRIFDNQTHDIYFDMDWLCVQTSEILKNISDSNWDGKQYSKINFHMTSNNIGSLLKRWKYDAGIEDSPASMSGSISWFEKPWSIIPAKMEGDAAFSLGKGHFTEVSDAKARIFSLFTMQSIARRLTLDFSDVFEEGFFYDKINGVVSLFDGKLYSDRLFIDGVAAKVNLSGFVDLNNQTIEQNAIVIPRLTSSLPLLSGWAAEPSTGFIVYILSKIMEPAIDVVSQIEYRIHGSLKDIQVEEIDKQSKTIVVEDDDEIEQTKNLPTEVEPVLEK